MAEPRPASHDDDPSAPLADRLLLALGIWPHHAKQAGDDEVVEAAVIIRTRAHREPMIAEDWGTERVLREELEAIVRDLAAGDPIDGEHGCVFCGRFHPQGHLESCPWRRAAAIDVESREQARELMEED